MADYYYVPSTTNSVTGVTTEWMVYDENGAARGTTTEVPADGIVKDSYMSVQADITNKENTVIGVDGKEYVIDVTGAGYKVDNWLRYGTESQLKEMIREFLRTGEKPTQTDLGVSAAQWKNLEKDFNTWLDMNDLNVNSFKDMEDHSFNAYYKDLYSLEEGTGGKEMYDQLAGIYQNQADQQAALANVQFQQQAMQQAATVKQITDQVRAERMARLKSGMSEAQIANQDMQMMMTNVNTLNQNAAMMNQERLNAQAATQSAQDQAYLAYLDQANARGQIATGQYAAQVGSVYDVAQQLYSSGEYATFAEAYTAASTGKA